MSDVVDITVRNQTGTSALKVEASTLNDNIVKVSVTGRGRTAVAHLSADEARLVALSLATHLGA